MTTAAYEGWKKDMLAGKTTMMAAGDGADVAELSARARADRIAAGQVEPGGIVLRDGNRAGCGDWIVTRHNDRRLSALGGKDFVKNGDAWTVERRYADGALTVKSMAHGGRVTLPADYVKAHVQLLYATTAHRAQGATVDTAHPLITDTMTREMLYVLATRARETTTLYVATHDVPFDDDAHIDQAAAHPDGRAAREILTTILSSEGAAKAATETIATAQAEAESLSTLVPRYQHAAQELAARRRQGRPDTDDLAAYVAELAAQIKAQAAKQEPPRPRPAPRRPAVPLARRPARQQHAPLLAPPAPVPRPVPVRPGPRPVATASACSTVSVI